MFPEYYLFLFWARPKQYSKICLLYGLTHYNCGQTPDDKSDRTSSIAPAFLSFVSALVGKSVNACQHFRYKAYMPTFAQDSAECMPLPDDQAVPGHGCVLAYNLKEENEENH
jgi:hypothetical protein